MVDSLHARITTKIKIRLHEDSPEWYSHPPALRRSPIAVLRLYLELLISLGLPQLLQDRGLQGVRLGGAGPSALDGAVAADEELLKVPLDALKAHEAGLLLLEPLIEGRGAVAVDVDLLHDGEADAIVDLAEVLDVVVGPGLLGAELVAGKAEDDKVVRVRLGELLVEVLEAGVLGGEAALGGRVDDEDNLALVILQGDFLAAL